MPSTTGTDNTETSRKSRTKDKKQLSSTNYENNLLESQLSSQPQQNLNNNNDHKTNPAQKRKKEISRLLVSDLSPKYIGFNPTVEGKRRGRSNPISNGYVSPITPKKERNIIENEGVLTNRLSYVKMTPINRKNDNLSSPSVDGKSSPDFESPIEKLIKKNKGLSNLSPSPSSTNNQQNDFISELETSTKSTQSFSTRIKTKSFVEHKNDKVIVTGKDNDIIPNSAIRKTKLLKQITIKKSKLKNYTKLVPLSNQIIFSELNKNINIESQEIQVKNTKNTPQKIRSAQVVLHKSPQIERMHNEQMRKRNSKILESVHRLSEMTKPETIENNKIENISKNYKTSENLSPAFSTLDLINTEVNNDKDCTAETDILMKIDSVVENSSSKILNDNENLRKNCVVLNIENCNNEKSVNHTDSSSLDLQKNYISSENEIKSVNVLYNDSTIMETKSEITKNSSIIEDEKPKTPILLDSENCKIITVIESKNIKSNQSIICSENVDDSYKTDFRSNNLSMGKFPYENIEISTNKEDQYVEKVEDAKLVHDIKYQKNESPEIDKFNNIKMNTYKIYRQSLITQIESKKITKVASSQTVESDKKIDKMDNKLLDTNKFTEFENSELTLENILCENDVLGTESNIDEDLDIMNISSDFDDLNNSTISELETSNLDVQIEEENVINNKDNRIEIDNEKLTMNNNNLPIIVDKTYVEDTVETIPEIVPITEKNSDELNQNDLINKKLIKDESIITNKTDVLNDSPDFPIDKSIISQKDTTIEQNDKELHKSIKNLPSTSKEQRAPDNEAFAYTLLSNARATKSPLSSDSAKGSSIDIETNFHPKFGEIFWARISKYPFWPCIVWPDPDGKTISIGKNGLRQHIRIHVKFFADNGRRSWIRKEDLMAFNGREDFERKKKEFWEQNNIGKRNLLAKAFLINESRKPLWNQAVIEASLVLNEHIEKRSEKFEKILEQTRELQFFERRKKRLSLNERRSSLSSILDSDDILNHTNPIGYTLKKRDRSPTPESPSFEDVEDFKTFVKKRKIDLNVPVNFNHIEKTSSLIQLNETPNSDIYEPEEIDFSGFTELMSAFIQPEKEDEKQLFINLKEIWEIKLRAEATRNFNLIHKNDNNLDGEQNFKRFSKRQSTLLFRRSLQVQKRLLSSSVTKEKSDKPKRERMPGVPIVKVVEDILELNKNYLFNGLKREPVCKVCLKSSNLYKCSGNCQSWIHELCAELAEAITLPTKTKDRKSIQNNHNTIINNSIGTNMDLSGSIHVTGDENLILDINKSNNENELLNISENVEIVQSMEIICKDCKEKRPPICYVCKEYEKCNNDNGEQIKETQIKCNLNSCGKYFHISCLKYWPQARLTKSKTKIERFICPSHTCQTCVSDDPKGKFLKLQNCAKCVLCPASYHIDSTCIPAGSKIITATELICPRHRQNKQRLNTNWCFICADGGNLVCCESCPTSFHIECLNIDELPDAGYICEECETGRLPLYGELIWAKFGVHKWWPCITIPPPQIPKNLYRVKHHEFDFCVRFFGTNDHSWISRDRVFLYQEDDWRYSSKVKTNDKDFLKALEEANLISELIKAKKKFNQNNDKKMLLVPPPYKKINFNRPVPPVKLQEVYINDELNPCNCDPNSEKPCDLFSGCLNRLLMIECHPKICPAGNKCNNQMFEKRLYAAVKVVRTSGRGFGLVSDELITIGTFIIEYVGELINDNELKRRIAQKQEEKDENYYFLTMQNGVIIDAGPKGNMARFMNHSCEPNCETQKWNINGNTRIGLFAITDIPPNTELTFNYNLECIGDDKKLCHCGAEKCAGFIGAKYKKIDKKNDILTSELQKTEKTKSKGGKRNKGSLGLVNNFPVPAPILSTIPKNS